MARKKRGSDNSGVDMDLTPMIDVTFLLIAFFIMVSQMASEEIAVLYLPTANIQEDKEQDQEQFILNITREGYVILRGERVQGDLLKSRLNTEASRSRIPDSKFSNRKILIRADRDALYDFVQLVMIKCTEVGIFQVQFAAKQKEKG